jgi:outer membrane protein assembly factor BamD
LSRLTEIYLKLGLVGEAKKTAAVLAYNYPGSHWYENSWNDLIEVGAIQGPEVKNGTPDRPGFFTRALGWVF